ncbi:SDR family NAD(P)-dependent oxidoreductase, partial [candidate division FCPU426 bacterium]|nr:SDR family NAD(P)-dependent oxidoreductase [candidate division FCPU426 bacterium]
MPKAVIIGATSGIGWALAAELSRRGWELGVSGRRQQRLQRLQAGLSTRVLAKPMDVRRTPQAVRILQQLIRGLGGMDLLVICAAISHRKATWRQEEDILATNVKGFAALARAGFEYFYQHGRGHLAGISSISGLRGRAENIAYSATKAFVSNYLQGLRQKAAR